MHRHLLVLFFVVSVAIVSTNASAQWQPTGLPVCAAAHDQVTPTLIPDGTGGALMTWCDFRSNTTLDIYAQRVNAFGVPQWTVNGIAVCTAVDDQLNPIIVPDAGTGAIIVWYDKRNGVDYDIYAQRLNASGVPQWAANGVALCTAVNDQRYQDVLADGAGGAIVVWKDQRAGVPDANIYAQRVNASGVPQWTANGVAVCTAASDQVDPHLKSDGAGGAIIVWPDFRSLTSLDIFAQRLNAAGVPQWVGNGVALCTELFGNQYSVQLTADGAGGAIATWQDDRNGQDSDVYAQRVNGSGVVQWVLDGVAASTPFGSFQTYPQIATDGAGGALITWVDTRNGGADDVYAQRIGSGGQAQWKLDGVAIASASGYQTNPLITSDGAGGAVIAWQDNRSGTNTDLYAQRVNGFGISQWTPNGAPLTMSPAGVGIPQVVWDGTAAIMAMHDFRNSVADIYAQRVEGRYGYWGHPEPLVTSVADVPKDQGAHVAINWTASQRDVNSPRTIDYYTVWRAVNTVPFGVDASQVLHDIKDVRGRSGTLYLSAGPNTDYYWELVGTQAAHGWAGYSLSAETRSDSVAGNAGNERFMVAAQSDADDFVAFQSNAVLGHSVDNLAPNAPLLLTIAQSGTNALLNWKAATDPDFDHYVLYRKTGSGVTPVPGNFLSNEALTNHADPGAAPAGYYYIVVAVDTHGNVSSPSNEVSLNSSTNVDGSTPPAHLVVDANAPNPFANASAFRVGLPRAGSIDVAIYDVSGRLVGEEHVAGVRGWQNVPLESHDSGGHTIASGVYFYRVRAGGETITHKMVIAR